MLLQEYLGRDKYTRDPWLGIVSKLGGVHRSAPWRRHRSHKTSFSILWDVLISCDSNLHVGLIVFL